MTFKGVATALIAALLLTGCSGIPVHRYNQYTPEASGWDDATHARILDQRIQLGDSRVMVYVAFGVPLKTATITDGQPQREHWEYLAYTTDPPYSGDGKPLISSPGHASLTAQTTNNLVFVSPMGPDPRLVVVEFDKDGKAVEWRLYPDAQGRTIKSAPDQIRLPKSPWPVK